MNIPIQELLTALDQWSDTMGKQLGPLTRPQRRFLRTIASHSGLTVSELADYLNVSTAASTRMLDKLVECQWVKRSRECTDQRQVRIFLTDDGQKALAEANQILEKSVSQSLAPLSVSEQRLLLELLRKLTQEAVTR